jgi:predicted nucleic acid-binding protein
MAHLKPLNSRKHKKSEALAQMTGIDIGEAQAVILTKQKNENLVLIDQSNAREVARHLGLTPRGTIYIILTSIKRKLITKEDAKQMLATLIEVNFYISAKIYRDALKTIEKL